MEFQYHKSKNQYGLNDRFVSDRDTDNSNIIEVTEIGIKAVFSVFYELLDLALASLKSLIIMVYMYQMTFLMIILMI